MSAIWTVLLFTLPAFVVALAGGAIAAWKPPSERLTAGIQHFAAGIVIAATSLELLPKERTEAAMPVVLGFGLGILLMLGLRVLARRLELRSQDRSLPTGLLVVTGLDLTIDGLVLGIAFAAGEKAGILLAIALTIEILFLAVSVTGSMPKGRKLLAIATPGVLALLFIGGAVLGRLVFGALAPFPFAVLLGVGIVAMLYLVVEELLIEAHEVEETPAAVAAFFGGFLAFLLIDMAMET